MKKWLKVIGVINQLVVLDGLRFFRFVGAIGSEKKGISLKE